jgi:glyceraldehyde 3-phosphate dehydrogenase
MSKPRVAINGFGRIGRIAFRANLASNLLDIVAINDPGDLEQHLVLLKYDSCYGVLDAEILIKNGNLVVNGKEIKYTQIRNPEELPWAEQKIDLVLECTGVFTDKAGAGKHITAGAKRVLISAPSKDADVTLCMGINQETFDPAKHTVISNASCTTNCLAPLLKFLNE